MASKIYEEVTIDNTKKGDLVYLKDKKDIIEYYWSIGLTKETIERCLTSFSRVKDKPIKVLSIKKNSSGIAISIPIGLYSSGVFTKNKPLKFEYPKRLQHLVPNTEEN